MKQTLPTTAPNERFTKTIVVRKTPMETFNAIRNFRGWWSEDIDGDTSHLNRPFFYHYKEIHFCKLMLTESIPGRRLVYRVLENEFNFVSDKTEWVGTDLVFDIAVEGAETRVTFSHDGLVPEYECFAVCKDAWSGYIGDSLRNYIETGKGQPNPKGEGGFNALLAKKWGLETAE